MGATHLAGEGGFEPPRLLVQSQVCYRYTTPQYKIHYTSDRPSVKY